MMNKISDRRLWGIIELKRRKKMPKWDEKLLNRWIKNQLFIKFKFKSEKNLHQIVKVVDSDQIKVSHLPPFFPFA